MRKHSTRWLIDPFERVAGAQALAIGVVIALLTSALALPIHAHFPGVIDYKLGVTAPFLRILLQNLIAIMDLTLCFYFGSIIVVRRRLRLIDFLGTLSLARLPYLLVSAGFALFSSLGLFHVDVEAVQSGATFPPSFIAMTLVTVLALIWLLILDFSALRVSSGLKGGKLWAVFIIGVVLAEALSVTINLQLAR